MPRTLNFYANSDNKHIDRIQHLCCQVPLSEAVDHDVIRSHWCLFRQSHSSPNTAATAEPNSKQPTNTKSLEAILSTYSTAMAYYTYTSCYRTRWTSNFIPIAIAFDFEEYNIDIDKVGMIWSYHISSQTCPHQVTFTNEAVASHVPMSISNMYEPRKSDSIRYPCQP